MWVFTKYHKRKLFLMLTLVSGVLLIGYIQTQSPRKSAPTVKSGPARLRYLNYKDWIISRTENTEIKSKEHQWKHMALQSSINWEKLTFYDPALKDSTTCADSKTSVITIRKKRQYYKIGDIVLVEITLKDSKGRRKAKGGDVVRIFVTTKKTKARAIASVLDGHNGTYIGVVKLLWAGEVIIQAKMCTPRELISLMYHNMRMGKIRRPIKGNFTQGGREVTMDCTGLEQIANRYQEVCNLTYRNADLPWYCEKPKGYSCDTWETHYPKKDTELNLTDQETRMISSVAYGGKIPMTLQVTVFADRPDKVHFSHKNNLIPCNKLPKRDTWNTTSPVGYMYNGTWYSTQCRTKFDGSKDSYEKCLTGKRVWLIGDSNMREMATIFMDVMNLTLLTEKWKHAKWKKESLASNKDRTISVFYAFHALPRFANTYINGTHQYIDSIPAGSNDIVVVHFLMHFMGHHPNVVRNHVRKTAQSVKALKVRAPNTTVVMRGSHSMFIQSLVIHHNDFWGFVYNQIFKEEFASMLDEVVFLNDWDITAASENYDMHPPLAQCKLIMDYMMGLICP